VPFKTGKLPPKHNPKTLYLSRYLQPGTLPTPAHKVFREYKTPNEAKQMFGNDLYGDCTCAGIANLLVLWTCHTGTVIVPTLEQVLAMYSAVTGFKADDPSTDNGAAMTDVLEYMQTTGLAGHKIRAWAKIDHNNLTMRRLGVDLFGATYVGVALPPNAQDQFEAGESWELTQEPDPNEGHAIIHPGYGSEGGDYVSWARWDQKASSAWEEACIDEEYVLISDDWLNAVTKKTPGGLDLATLEADLKLIAA